MEAGEEYDKLIWPVKSACRAFASWPARRRGLLALRAHQAHQALMVGLLALIAGAVTIDMAVFWGEDMNETIECSLVCSAFYMAVLRVLVFIRHEGDMLYVVETMRRDWTESSADDRLLLRTNCRLTFKFAKLFITNVMMTCSAFIFMPILELTVGDEQKRVLPFRGYLFFNHTVSPTYEIVYVANAIVGTFGCSTIAGATSFSFVASLHAAAKFAMVRKEIGAFNSEDWNSGVKMRRCIERHQEAIRFAETVENTINFLALAQFLISTGLLCFAGFQVTTMLEDSTRLTKYLSFLIAATMELFIFSYSGQSLKTESENVADSAYFSKWAETHSSSNIRFIMMRARKPCTITAGKFYDMSLESFLKVMSSSFSYFTVLLAMKEE